MSSNNTSDVKSVVLIGFQFAGANFYRQLHKYLPASTAVKITIVNDRPYLFHNIASLRAVCDPSGRWIDLSFVPIDPQSALLGRKETELLIDSLVKVNKDSVELKSGKTLPFNYLILATGSSYRSPAKIQQPTIDDAKREMSSLSDKVQQSQSILVIGGGPVGVELAAELKSAYPEKQIALVHNTDQILPAHGLNEKAVRKTRSVLDSLGVKVVLGERIQISDWATFDPLTAKTLLTDKGNELKSDMQFICTGARPNTAYMSGEFHSSLDERQLIKVDRSLRVEGTQNIYAMYVSVELFIIVPILFITQR
jgi:NADH dehydrogenase FAD-containing subunit